MCGIVGVVGYRGQDLRGLVSDATREVFHRGPDDGGVCVLPLGDIGLGHRRLSIIDLSERGHQPMVDVGGSVWITFNGEIYNHKELRQELSSAGYRFRSESDTEVVLNAYRHWGDEHVQHLRGMFAYAIADTSGEASRVVLVRDRLGIKPLHYSWDGERLVFGSELRSLLRFPWIDRSIDLSAISDYLTFLCVPAPKTVYRGIRALEPATMLVLEGNAMSTTRYWSVSPGSRSDVGRDEAVAETSRLLEEAVLLHTVSDVPVGVFLSGGIDSSGVTSLLSHGNIDPLATFSIAFDIDSHSEAPYARAVADHLGTEHHERTVGVGSMQEMLGTVVDLYGSPFADGSAIPTYRVSELARERVKVVLSGDGGDEVFGGYVRYGHWKRRHPWARIGPGPFSRVFSGLARYAPTYRLSRALTYAAHDPVARYGRTCSLFTAEEKELVAGPVLRDFVGCSYDDYWVLRPHWLDDVDPMTQAQYLDLNTYLPNDILTKVDRASMAHSLEVRPPLLDHVLVDYVMSLPSEVRTPGGELKSMLRDIVRDGLPPVIMKRGKQGFSSPFGDWLSEEGSWAEKFITEGRAVGEGLLDPSAVTTAQRTAPGGRIWALLVLEEWFRREVDAG